MLSRRHVQALRDFAPGEEVVLSLYLDVAAERHPRREYQIKGRNLLREARDGLSEGLPREVRKAAEEDMERAEQFLALGFQREGPVKGVALFSCGPRQLWETFALPASPADEVVMSPTPYLRPLWLQLYDHPRVGVVLLDRAGARFLLSGPGEVREVAEMASDVPSQVRVSGWAGLKGRRVERHIDDHVLRHVKEVAEETASFCQEEECDYLALGGNEELAQKLLEEIGAPWRQRFLGFVPVASGARAVEVAAQVQALREKAAQAAGREALDALLGEIKGGGMAVTGLAATLRALQEGAVSTLVVDREFHASGFRCPACGHLALQAGECPRCRRTLLPVADLVTEMVEMALERECQVQRVDRVPRLDQLRGIGGMLRFQPAPA